MKTKPYILALVGSALLIGLTQPVYAKAVYMLQLGSYTTKEEATARWDNLGRTHGDALAGLGLYIAAASGDKGAVLAYRTQAGPIENRAKAEEVCSKLLSAGETCFVVESAMRSKAPSTSISPVTSEMKSEPVEPASVSTTDYDDSKETVLDSNSAQQHGKALSEQALEKASYQPNEPETPKPTASIIKPEPAPPATKLKTTLEPAPLPWQSSTSTPAVTSEPAAPEVMPELSTPATEAAPAAPETTEAANDTADTEDSSWLGRLFSSKDDQPSLEEKATQLPDPLPEPKTFASGYVTPRAAVQPRTTRPASVEMAQIDTPAMPVTSPAPVSETRPLASRSGFLKAPDSYTPLPSSDASIQAPAGNVQVDEAIRVPLTTDTSPVATAPARAVYQPSGKPRGFPSQAEAVRALWAKISSFVSEQTARSFWDEFRYENPDATYGARARITRPYNAGDQDPVSLRIGVYSYMDKVREVCHLIQAKNATLRCSAVSDLGSSSAYNERATRTRNRDSGYVAAPRITVQGSGYWLHLGSYGSPKDAEYAWNRMKKSNRALLGRLQNTITMPPRSSSPERMYRLRTGPFISNMAAMNMCGKLKARGVNCIVVSGR